MDANGRPTKSQPARRTFSLGTLFLLVTCAGVAAAGFRVAGDFFGGSACACFFVAAFLAVWFLATMQFGRLRYAGTVFGCGLLFGLFAPFQAARDGHSAGTQCTNHLKQLAIALLAYHQTYGSFPPAYVTDANGKPLYSWRALILPQLDQGNLARRIRPNEPWNGPNNRQATQTPLWLFACPSGVQFQGASGTAQDLTSYVAVVGPNTAWTGAKPRKLSEFKNPSKTILLVEVENSGIHWAEPRDLYIGQMPLAINPPTHNGISSDHPGGANVVFADGHVEFLPNSTTPAELAAMLDIDGRPDRATAAKGAKP